MALVEVYVRQSLWEVTKSHNPENAEPAKFQLDLAAEVLKHGSRKKAIDAAEAHPDPLHRGRFKIFEPTVAEIVVVC